MHVQEGDTSGMCVCLGGSSVLFVVCLVEMEGSLR